MATRRDVADDVAQELHGPVQVAPPEIERAGMGYVARFPMVGIDMRLRHLKLERGETRASLTVTTTPRLAGQVAGHLYHGNFNLSGLASRNSMAKYLKGRWEANWDAVLEQLCLAILRLEEEGEPAILLRDAPAPTTGSELLGSLALARHPVIWFGDGGSAKSYLGLAAALSIHTGLSLMGIKAAAAKRVAYLDWEFDAWEHKTRMKRLLGGDLPDDALPDIVYVRCLKPLSREAERIGHVIADHGIEYIVVDSIAWACEGPPEEAASATGFFEALRGLGVGSLNIAHVNRTGDTDKPFGSIFWHNGARATWFVKKQQEHGQDGLDVGFFNRKANSNRLELPLGFSVHFGFDQTRITRVDVRDVPELATNAPLKDRMVRLLGQGAKSTEALAEELGVSVNTVSHTVTRWNGRAFYRAGTGSTALIGLLATAQEEPS